MSDQPAGALPLFISSSDFRYSSFDTLRGQAGPGVGSITWPSANLAIYIPFQLPFAYPVSRVLWTNGPTASGNVAYGIYSDDGAKLYASASTAQSGASATQFVAADKLLSPGSYYHALIVSATTASLISGLTGLTALQTRMAGLLQEAVGSMTLPDVMTPATYGQTFWPMCGFTRTQSGY